MSSTLAAQQRVSRTAYDCAGVRATVFASTQCRSFDYLAADLVSSSSASIRARAGVALLRLGATALTSAIVSRTSPGVDVFLFARQAVPDAMAREALDADPDSQVVILGAGLDTSGLRIGAERRTAGKSPGTFFEVDLPATQAEKRTQVTRLLRKWPDLDESNLVYVPCSFGDDEIGTALRGAGFDASKPTVWVWSGVIHYLPEEAVRASVAELRNLSSAGSRLFFDFILLEAYDRPDKYGFARNKARFDAFGEVMSFGFREGTEHVREWLEAQGLSFVRTYTNLDMVSLYEEKTGRPAPSRGTPWSNLCVAEF